MKTGTYLDTSESEYRAWDALNYSKLADFYDSPDVALQVREDKSYFEFGRAFELLAQDVSKGTYYFEDRFFICNAKGLMPDKLAQWVETGADLSTMFKLNKDGSRSKAAARKHDWLDACIQHPGKMPMSQFEYDQLCIMLCNFMDMIVYGHQVRELLKIADFQVPILWEHNGVLKKALLDVLINTGAKVYPFDIKTAADTGRFKRSLRSRYWIQDTHYSEGVTAVCDEQVMSFMFLVASKQEPFLAQPFGIEDDSYDAARDEYDRLCSDFIDWDQAGRPAKGYRAYEDIKLYF